MWPSVLLVVLALVGCGGGAGGSSDGGASDRGGATGLGGATGAGGGGTGGDGAAGITGVAGTGGSAGTIGSAGTNGSAGTIGSAGTNGSAGAGGTAGAGTGGRATGGIGGMNCRPDILIVQDRSGSMNDDPNDNPCNGGCGLNSKWAVTTTAITNVVGATDGSVNWGIKFFPNNNACDASAAPAVGIAPSNAAAVVDSIDRTQPGGTTPTRDAITYGTTYLQSLTDTNPKFLLLATDGLPNCPAGCAPMSTASAACTLTDNPNEDLAAEAAVAAAATQGIKTFVIGIGIGAVATEENTLNQLAINGGEAQTGTATSYYPATDEAALEAALTSIVSKIAGCPH
jgi:hypothetical protein